jgi:hypothetical protein
MRLPRRADPAGDGAGDDGGNAVGLDEGKPDLTSATI